MQSEARIEVIDTLFKLAHFVRSAHASQVDFAERAVSSLASMYPALIGSVSCSGPAIHAIVDNYATHKHAKVRQWLAQHPHWTFHFTPTSASWLNAVEGFFAKLTRRRLERGVFRSLDDLKAAIDRFVAETNADPKPFVWTAKPSRIFPCCQTREARVRVDQPTQME
jgi:hypothetical protein